MAVTLDRSRPFGTVTPIYEGAAFAQDGRHFGPDGKRVLLPGEVDDEPVRHKAAVTQQPAAAIVADAVAKSPDKPRGGRPKGSTNKPKAPKAPKALAPAAKPAAPIVEGEVNLTAWATGSADYIMADVYKAIRTRYSRNVTNEADAIETLINEGVVTADDVKRG
jgi:hypothetical protein